MLFGLLSVFSPSVQAQLNRWSMFFFSDPYDAMLYDNLIQEQLQQLNLHFETYTPVSFFDYHHSESPHWKVLVCDQGEWRLINIANPYYSAPSTAKVSPIPLFFRM